VGANKREFYVQITIAAVSSVLVAAVLGLASTIRELSESGDYFPVAVLIIVVASLGREIYRQLRRPSPPQKLITAVFSGLATPSNDQIWMHPTQTQKIAEAIKSESSKPLIVTGPSGAGKSIMLRNALPQEFSEDCLHVVDDYSSETLDSFMAKAANGDLNGKVILFDQIEGMLLSRRSKDTYTVQRAEHTSSTINALIQSGARLVLAVRSERVADLIRLNVPLPSLSDSLFIDRIAPDDNVSSQSFMWKAFINRLSNVVDDDEMDAIIKEFSASSPMTPMEMQVVGAIHEIRAKHPRAGAPRTVSPDVGALWLLNNEVLTHDQPLASIEMLYVLGQLRLAGVEIDAVRLGALTDEPDDCVAAALQRFVEAGIVRTRLNGRITLVHDYLQPVVESLAAEWMTPTERDTLRDLARRFITNRQSFDEVTDATMADRTKFPQIIIGMVFFIAAAGLIRAIPWADVQRLFFPIDTLEPMRGGGLADGVYLPIVFPHVAWCWYIFMHAHRAYRFTDRLPLDRLATKTLLLVLIVSMIIGVLMPAFWICAIALGGLAAAAKSFQISLSTSQAAVRTWFRDLAMKTTINSTIAMVGGLLWGRSLSQGAVNPEMAQRWQYGLMLLLFFGALALRAEHISYRQARLLRILVRRSAFTA
jgi:hypothetical protein